MKLYYALIHSHFNYGFAVWGSTYPTYLNKLKLLENKAIRIVTFSQMSTSSKPLYIKSNILPLPKLFEFEIAKIVYFYTVNLICYLRFLITTFHMLNPAIFVPQDFHLTHLFPEKLIFSNPCEIYIQYYLSFSFPRTNLMSEINCFCFYLSYKPKCGVAYTQHWAQRNPSMLRKSNIGNTIYQLAVSAIFLHVLFAAVLS